MYIHEGCSLTGGWNGLSGLQRRAAGGGEVKAVEERSKWNRGKNAKKKKECKIAER